MKLLPCPFCGSSATALRGEVSCDSCGCEVKRGTTADAIEDWNRRPASHPTPVQGEALPVVGTVQHLNELNDEWLDKLPIGMTLTDHAQATAEIARLQGANAALKQRLGEFSDECFTLRTQLSDATGQVGRLRDGLKHALAASVNAQMVIVKELPAHNWIPGLEKDIEAARAALNSTAPKE
jgi:hypothetical protein